MVRIMIYTMAYIMQKLYILEYIPCYIPYGIYHAIYGAQMLRQAPGILDERLHPQIQCSLLKSRIRHTPR